MLNAISGVLTNNTLVNIAQSTRTAMSVETCLKATGRPAFILMDNKISEDTKKYAATKELLYQLTCLAVYIGLVLPVFRKCGFQFFKKVIFKDNHGFGKFNNLNEFSRYKKIKELPINERLAEIQKHEKGGKKAFADEIRTELLRNRNQKPTYHIVKGADELSSITGSVVGLAILAPQVSHITIHPIMKFLGMDKKQSEQNTNKASLDQKA